MKNSQQLFEINKRINQIQRQLQVRQQKACEWSVPYDKILRNNSTLSQKCQVSSLNSHNVNMLSELDSIYQTIPTKTQRQLFFKKRVKESRKKIRQHHNQLKQIQQLLVRRTLLYVKKQSPQQKAPEKQNMQKYGLKSKNQSSKNMKRTFSNSMLYPSASLANSSPKISVRTLKDRLNPFNGFKIQKMIQLFQQGKGSGKDNTINHMLGIGIQYTPYSTLRKERRREDESKQIYSEPDTLSESINLKTQHQQSINSLPNKNDQEFKSKRNLPNVIANKIISKTQVYVDNLHSSQLDYQGSLKKKKRNVFQVRMKKILQQSNHFQACQGNYQQGLRKGTNMTARNFNNTSMGKIKANHPYKTVFQLN